jgi:hypothetical protein
MRLEDKIHSLTYEWSATALYGTLALVSFVTIWLWYSWVFVPVSCALDGYEIQVAPLSAHAGALDECQKTCDTLTCEVDTLQQRLCDSLKKCTCDSSYAVIAHIFKLCDEHHIGVKQFKLGSVTQCEGYSKEIFNLEFVASHDDAQRWYKAVQASSTLVGITSAAATLQADGLFAHACVLEHLSFSQKS